MRVLLVDDEIELVSALAERLFLRGMDVRYVTSGDAALQEVRAAGFDVIVLDVKMPGIAGMALKRKLASIRPDMHYIFLTGYGSDSVVEEVRREADKSLFLFKPVDIDELVRSIYQHFGQNRKE